MSVSKFESSPIFEHHPPEIKKELVATMDVVSKLEPWSLFLYARSRLIKEMATELRSFPEIARLLSCDPLQVQMIFEGTNPEEHGSIIPKLE